MKMERNLCEDVFVFGALYIRGEKRHQTKLAVKNVATSFHTTIDEYE